jgi:hypothetical protein
MTALLKDALPNVMPDEDASEPEEGARGGRMGRRAGCVADVCAPAAPRTTAKYDNEVSVVTVVTQPILGEDPAEFLDELEARRGADLCEGALGRAVTVRCLRAKARKMRRGATGQKIQRPRSR